jgi:signal transduction histidine kinase
VSETLAGLVGDAAAPGAVGRHWAYQFLMSDLISDSLIGLAYCSAALALVYFVHKRQDFRLNWLIALFSLFIFGCGVIHLLSALGQWNPDEWLRTAMKTVTAVVVATAAILLWPVVLRAVKAGGKTLGQLQGVIAQLEHEIAERERAQEALQQSRALLRQLAAYQEQIKEDERKRIAREIHDELGQNLMALRIDVSLLQARTGQTHPILNRKVRNALQQIDTTIKAVRSIINNLRPSVLDLGLFAAIEWQIKEFERRTGIRCELEGDSAGYDLELDDQRATAFFRILQESLTNVARHAQAQQVRVRLQRLENRFEMTIEDDGVGLFAGCRRKPNSFGLLGIEERVSSLGGEFHVDSVPGSGTRLSISIPLHVAIAA